MPKLGRGRPNRPIVERAGLTSLATVAVPNALIVTHQPSRRFRRPPTATLIRNTIIGTTAGIPSGRAGVVSPSVRTGAVAPSSLVGVVSPSEKSGGA